VPQNTFIWL